MKSKRIFEAVLIVLSLCILVALVSSFTQTKGHAGTASNAISAITPAAVGSVQSNGQVTGNSSVVFQVSSGSVGVNTVGAFNFGLGSVALSGSAGVLSGGSSTIISSSGTGNNIPVANAYVAVLGLSSTNVSTTTPLTVLMGSSSSTCTFPLYATSTSGTAGTMYYALPQINSLGQQWFALSVTGTGSTQGTVHAQVEMLYDQ